MKETENTQKGLSRRRFLGLSLAAAGAAAVGGKLAFDAGLSTLGATEVGGGSKWVKHYCGSCIWTNCGTEVKVKNGVAVEIRGNKEHPANKGTLCPRGAAQLMGLYNPYRIKTPLKRTNPKKGLDVDPGWVEITWDEALDTVAEKIKAAQAADPRKLMIMYGFAGALHETPFVKLFTAIFGTPNYSMSCGPLCEVHHAPALFHSTFVDRIDMGHCNYVIAFGRNMGGSAMFASGPGRALADAVERGMKVVVIDPHAGPDAAKGEWVPIRPGSDYAMAMAMLHVLLHELNIYDEDAMKNRSNAPYLINADGDYERDAATNKPLIWDLSDNSAKAYDDPTLSDIALEGTYSVNGKNVKPAFVLIKESVQDSTPEWAEEKSDVTAETIRRITKELADAAQIGSTITVDGYEFPYRPAVVAVGRGTANNPQGQRFYVLADIINLVLGAIGVPGSLLRSSTTKFCFEDGMMRENPMEYYTTARDKVFKIPQNDYTSKMFYPLSRFPILGATMEAIIDPEKFYLDHTIDVLFPYGANPFINDADSTITEEAFKKVPFIFTCGYHMDETALFCDVIFPECSHMERVQIRPIEETMTVDKETVNLYGINYKEPVVDLVYNTRQFDDVVIGLTDRLGLTAKRNMIYNGFYALPKECSLAPDKTYTYPEMIDIRLKGFTGGKGIDYFRENGFFIKNKPLREAYEYSLFNGKGRLPLYNWRDFVIGKHLRANLEKCGVEIPGWEGNMEAVYSEFTPVPEWIDSWLTVPSEEFDMICANWKVSVRNLGIGHQDDNMWLREIVENQSFDDYCIQINPVTAKAKGLKDGDSVIVESQHGGQVEGVLKVTNLVHPEVLGFPGQGGRVSKAMNPVAQKGVNYNKLLTYKEGFIFGNNGSIAVSSRVKIKKA
jgi:anaerobic selenocysteine-containing dehydrogenase